MKKAIFIPIIILVFIILSGMFEVQETEKVIKLRFGKVIGKPIEEAGLYLKMPLLDQIVRFDKRLLEYDSEPTNIITKDKKTITIDNYARWKIADPLLFLQAVHDERGAQERIDDVVYSELRERIGNYDLNEIVSSKREEITEAVTTQSDKKLREFGIKIIDIRIKRADLPPENQMNIYKRMQTEREQQAKKYRAEGQQKAVEIRSKSEQERTIILAEAYKKSQELKGEGDAQALQIYADAYNKDKEFYKFMRTMEAYEKIFNGSGKNTIMMSTKSDIFYMLEGK